MSKAVLGKLKIEYQIFGNKKDPAVVLISGWRGQKNFWSKTFVDHLVDNGFRVVVFDNRDAGESERVKSFYLPPAWMLIPWRFSPFFKYYAPYSVEDMADDVAALLKYLDISKAHVAGFSLGGMISQVFAAKYPKSVLSLTILGSTTNKLALPAPRAEAFRNIFFKCDLFLSHEKRVDLTVRRWKSFGTRDGHQDTPEFREKVEQSLSHASNHMAIRRQFAATVASGDIGPRYSRRIKSPTLVLHGTVDGMLPLEHGKDIAKNIKNSRFEVIEGWGHDLAPSMLPNILPLMTGHLKSVSA